MPELSTIYEQLREVLIETAPEAPIEPTADLPHVYGVVVDVGFELLFTVAAFADRRTLACDSNGGGFNDLAESPEGLVLGHSILRGAEEHLDMFAPVESKPPLPAFGRVRFTVLTYDGKLGVELDGPPLLKGQSPLSHVFTAVMGILDRARRMVPQPQPGDVDPGAAAPAN
jgi:hypothetical protein